MFHRHIENFHLYNTGNASSIVFAGIPESIVFRNCRFSAGYSVFASAADYVLVDSQITNLIVNESASIIINVVCKEQQTTDYEIIIILEPDGGSNRTLSQYDFTLDDDAQWELSFDFNVNGSGTFRLNIELYKEDESEPYASNHLWLDARN